MFILFVFSRLLHLQFGITRYNHGDINDRKKHVFHEETTATPSHAIPSFRLPDVLGNRNKRMNILIIIFFVLKICLFFFKKFLFVVAYVRNIYLYIIESAFVGRSLFDLFLLIV